MIRMKVSDISKTDSVISVKSEKDHIPERSLKKSAFHQTCLMQTINIRFWELL